MTRPAPESTEGPRPASITRAAGDFPHLESGPVGVVPCLKLGESWVDGGGGGVAGGGGGPKRDASLQGVSPRGGGEAEGEWLIP